jgi:hypothetical protein
MAAISDNLDKITQYSGLAKEWIRKVARVLSRLRFPSVANHLAPPPGKG